MAELREDRARRAFDARVVPARPCGDADGARAAAARQRHLERPRLLVDARRRQRRDAVRGERAAEVDGLAAGADERQLGDHGRRARARHRCRRNVYRCRLLPRRRDPHREGADGGEAGGVGRRRGARGRRRRRRALHARDDGRDERAARAQGRAHGVRDERGLRASAAPAAAEPRRRSTGSARAHPEPLVPLERCVGVRGRIGPGRRARAARPRLAAGARRRGGRGLPAARVPRPVARARGRGRAAAPPAGRARRRVARDRARVPRVRARVDDRDRRVPRPGRRRATCARSPSGAPTPGLPAPLVMRSSGGVAELEEAAAHPAVALVSGPAAGVVGAARGRARGGLRERDRVRHGRHVDRRLPDRRRRGRAHVRARRRRLSGPAADGRHPHGRRRRRLDRLARRGRRAARRAGERGRGSRARRATAAAARGRR